MSTVSLVAVGDDTLEAVRADDGAVWVPVRRVCDTLGISADAQLRRLQREPWATTTMMVVVGHDGRRRESAVVALKTLPMWLATIEVSRLDPAVAPKLVRFQLEAHDALAAHFGVGGRANLQSRTSGGPGGSGGAVVAARPAGGALEMLAVAEQMMGALRATLAEVDAVRADVARVEGAVADANARSADVALLVDSMAKKGVHFRESARAIKNATAYVSRRIKAEAPYTNYDWRTIFGAARNELGLARSPASSTTSGAATKAPRAKPIGESIKRADQVLTYARVATKHGISGCDVRTINAILNADDDANVVDAETQALQ